ncbi:MAG: hypothetical protein DKT66_11390 [Candidatus Melainabacteria bacterium]|nr:MAG: hypothetical protein DKT66_11390 [Candidatus Melainabacteria bacterium]
MIDLGLEALNEDSANQKEELAASENASATILKQLAFDSSESVRLKVAENPHTPISVLDSLCYDSSRSVRITSKVRLLQRLAQRYG